MMIRAVNYVALQDQAEVDGICFNEDELDDDEPRPFSRYSNQLLAQAKIGAGRADNHLIEYAWNGYADEMPWAEHGIAFDPHLVSVIIPETGSHMQIRGERRRVLLTFPPMFRGTKPVYFLNLANERAIDYIRVLPDLAHPFKGLERAFSHEGFMSLPQAKGHSKVIFGVGDGAIIVPSSSLEVF